MDLKLLYNNSTANSRPHNTVQKFKSNRQEWIVFGQFVRNAAIALIRALSTRDNVGLPEARKTTQDLFDVLQKIQKELEETQREHRPERIRLASKDRNIIADMKMRVDGAASDRHRDLSRNFSAISPKQHLSNVLEKYGGAAPAQGSWAGTFSDTTSSTSSLPVSEAINHASASQAVVFNTSNLDGGNVINVAGNFVTYREIASDVFELSYAKGVSWNAAMTCLPGTRVPMLSEIEVWAYAVDSQNVLWLKGVAGSGKSAISHSIAQILHQAGRLASSFFFSRDIASLSTPFLFITTIARDIASHDTAIAEDMNNVLQNEPALASAHFSQQFEMLISGPLRRSGKQTPFILIIDALDEGIRDNMHTHLLSVLRDDVPALASHLRILVTSRPTNTITQFLSSQNHIKSLYINIHTSDNQTDIALYIKAQLSEGIMGSRMSLSLPDETEIHELTALAEGLFIWIVTLFKYLRSAYNPKEKLAALLSKSAGQGLALDKKMDDLYTGMLEASGDWEDPDFVKDYQTVLGAVMALKQPLSLAALKALHGGCLPGVSPEALFERLGSVLVGFDRPDEPIRMLHLSFREFVTERANNAEHTRRFYIPEKEYSNKLVELCLQTMVREFAAAPIPGTGYLAREDGCIQEVTGVSEQMIYACGSLIEHIDDVKDQHAGITMTGVVQEFLSHHMRAWIEIVSSIGVFHGSLPVLHWVQVHAPQLRGFHNDEAQSFTLLHLSRQLQKVGRVEEALKAIRESIDLRRAFEDRKPSTFNADLVKFLSTISVDLSKLDRNEEALIVTRELVDLRRALAAENPALLNPDLANSLDTMSSRLSKLGRHEEALAVT
ncbi:hypothetical protein HWV62_40850 [Athelia sp. TMB]|nr:hypothetical protein HWV62_40850 [Athelia sp. TMB]